MNLLESVLLFRSDADCFRPPSPTPSRASSLSVASEGKKSNASGKVFTLLLFDFFSALLLLLVLATILCSGKFGASSPERERKLLSLAEDKVGLQMSILSCLIFQLQDQAVNSDTNGPDQDLDPEVEFISGMLGKIDQV